MHRASRGDDMPTSSDDIHAKRDDIPTSSDDIQPKGLMIYECISRHRRVIHSMIYQACGLDKKILVPKNEDFLRRADKKDIFKSFRTDLNSRTKSRRRRAYHQNEVLYITKAKALYIIIAKEHAAYG